MNWLITNSYRFFLVNMRLIVACNRVAFFVIKILPKSPYKSIFHFSTWYDKIADMHINSVGGREVEI